MHATLSLAFERVEHTNPAAADLLRLCAFLYPDEIPLRGIAATTTDLGPYLSPIVADPCLLDTAIAALRSASLVHRHGDTHTLTIHRLIQVVIQSTMNKDT